jgi:glutamine synthetase
MDAKVLSYFETWLNENEIVDVECATPDMAGAVCGKTLQVDDFLSHVSRGGLYLAESVFGMTIDGDFILGDVLHETEPDLLFRPDPATLRRVPWYKDATALVLGDFFHHDGKPVNFSPRRVLQRVLEFYAKEGWDAMLAPEFEFYFVSKPHDFVNELEAPAGRVGLTRETLHPYGLDAVDRFDDLFIALYEACEAQNLEVGTLTQEAGPAQYEVNFNHGPVLEAADRAFLFKRCVRRIALDHGLVATFMAKPYKGHYGSAMHIHQNVLDKATGKNLFADESGDTKLLRNHVAGLQKYFPQVMPMFAPYPNSYRRFARYLSSPMNTHWGHDNRSVGLRIPVSGPGSRRVENRVPGADVNPYLAIAASLACGYLGMKEGVEPDEPLDSRSAYDSTGPELTTSHWDALETMQKCEPMREILGNEFVTLYTNIKAYEFEKFDMIITPWEREHLLLSV